MHSACPQQTERPGGEAAGRRRGTIGPCLAECSHSACPQRKEHARCQRRGHRVRGAPKRATRLTPPPHRGGQRGSEAGGEAKKGRAPPTADKCRASCLHRARNVHTPEKRQQGRPPPPQEGDEDGVPPADRAARWGGSRERTRYNRAVPRRVLAPCLPPTEGTCQGRGHRVRRATKGATRLTPPPHSGRKRGAEASGEAKKGRAPPRRQVPCLVPASCSQRACSGGQTTRAPPPPLHPHPPRKGTRTARRRQGDMGGGRRRDHKAGGRDERQAVGAPGSLNPAMKLTNKVPERGKKVGGKQGTARTRESRKERGKHQGRKRGGARANTADGGGRGDKSPKETLARDPTPGVWGPPR